MTPEQEQRIAELNVAYGLDGGGYSFEEPPKALEGMGTVVWEDPDPDYVPWIRDGEYGDFYGVRCPLYVFTPNSGHFARSEFPSTYMEGESKYVLLSQGTLNETDRECHCHGKQDAASNWEFTGNVLDPPHPSCTRCEGDGYIVSDGGEWALYGEIPEELIQEDAEYLGDETNGVYYQVCEYCGKYFVNALIDTEHAAETLLKQEGPFESEEEALLVGSEAAAQWCLENEIEPED